jgi:hypothetical protein
MMQQPYNYKKKLSFRQLASKRFGCGGNWFAISAE